MGWLIAWARVHLAEKRRREDAARWTELLGGRPKRAKLHLVDAELQSHLLRRAWSHRGEREKLTLFERVIFAVACCAALAVVVTVIAIVLSGCTCERRVYPGDGSLVVVDLDPSFSAKLEYASHTPATTSAAALIEGGLRYWDVVGANFRADVSDKEPAEIAAAPHLRLREGGAAPDDDGEFFYRTGDVSINVFWSNPISDDDCLTLETTAAHEIGHALGLDHASESTAVMYKDIHPTPALTEIDIAAFQRRWPRAAP